MTDDQHGEGTPQDGGRWDPLPQGDYDDGATAFVQLPEGGIDALLSGDSPLAAPGHGYVPPQITATPPAHDGTDPAAGAWGAPAGGTGWPDPNAVPAQEPGAGDRFTYNPGATGQWNFGDANGPEPAPGPGHDVTGQWSIPVAGGDLPDESGEYSTSALLEQWGGTPPATLPGGAPAPWATGPGGAGGEPWGQTAPGADPYAQPPGPYDSGAPGLPGGDAHGGPSPAAGAAEAERYASAADAALDEAHMAAEASSTAAVYETFTDSPALPGATDTHAGHGPGYARQSESTFGQGVEFAFGESGAEQPPRASGAGTAYDTAPGSAYDSPSGPPEEASSGFPDAPTDGFPDTPAGPTGQTEAQQQEPGTPHGSVSGVADATPGATDGSTSGPEGDAPSGFPGESALGAERPEEGAPSGAADGSDSGAEAVVTADFPDGRAPGDGDGTPEGLPDGAASDASPPLPPERPASAEDTGANEEAQESQEALESPASSASPDRETDATDMADGADPAPGDGTDPAPAAVPAPDAATPHDAPAPPQEEHPLASYVLRVNGVDRPVTDAWIGESLLYVLRERLGLAGAKDGCSQGECGACNVQVDGRLVASCLVPSVTAAGSEVRTVEGLAVDGQPSDVQRALARCGAVQCGFCVPGMAMTVHDLLEGNPAPTELETRQALCGNLCRCSGYRGVLEAVNEVVAEREAHTAADGETDTGEARIPHQAGPGAGGVHPSAFDSPGFPSANGPNGPQGHTGSSGPHDQAYGQDGGQA
ncbi:2Fe-2S iron-sulfur cluster-binding protein [Streptomyces sp. NPDC048751]|uniref:2Fe-2S iron-sulfur cluster-binding protein n=1 Tax=Streptomyces sp. NPDC048751 TaxID=3365591 RepID=UPI0037211A5E